MIACAAIRASLPATAATSPSSASRVAHWKLEIVHSTMTIRGANDNSV